MLEGLARKHSRVDVICPGFVADCLETLEEIGIEGARPSAPPAARRSAAALPQRPAGLDRGLAIADNLGGWVEEGPRPGRGGGGGQGERRASQAARSGGVGSGGMRLIVHWLINAAALFVLPYVLSSIQVKDFVTALVVALVLGLVNAIIRPILVLLTLPVTILTLGFFILVINALLFWGVASFVDGFGSPGTWSAFWGAIIYALVSWAIAALLLPSSPNRRSRAAAGAPRPYPVDP